MIVTSSYRLQYNVDNKIISIKDCFVLFCFCDVQLFVCVHLFCLCAFSVMIVDVSERSVQFVKATETQDKP